MQSTDPTPPSSGNGPPVWQGLVALAVIAGIIFAAANLADWVKAAIGFEITDRNRDELIRIILITVLIQAVLMSLPFVPGVELGLILITVLGPIAAPYVYAGCALALLISYGVGRLVPPHRTAGTFRRLRLHRAADAVARHEAASPAERLDMLLGRFALSGSLAARYRYVAIGLAITTPGNIVIGGGGGIALMAGLSRLFSPPGYILTVLIAVAPIPFGAALLAS